jgi:hypothetical protein
MAAVDLSTVELYGPSEFLTYHEEAAVVTIEPVED